MKKPDDLAHLAASLPLPRLLENLHEAVVVTDAQIERPGPTILYANPAFTRITGWSADQLQGRTPRILQGPRTDRRVLDHLKRCLQNGETFEGETINYRQDGTAFVMRWYIEPIRDEENRITHFFAIQRDVTAERQESHRRRALEQAIEQLTELVVLFRPDGTVRYANGAYLSWSKYPEEEVVGARVWRIPGFPALPVDLRWARTRLARGEGWQREYPVQGPPGEEPRLVLVTVTPIWQTAEEDLAEYVAVGRDVTERRRLSAVAEAQNFHENLGVVFSGIRHELANPINSVKAALQVITDGFPSMGEDKLRSYLERMGVEIGRVEYLLRSLRTYSLYDKPRLEAVDARAFLARFRRLALKNAEEQGIELTVETETEGLTLWADPQGLYQVLLNLLSNASQALEDRKAGRIEIRARREGAGTVLHFRDDGPGISHDDLPHVFKPFYTTRPGSNGLGLAIARHLLSVMGGDIELYSSSQGTEAVVFLCRPPAQPSASSNSS